MVCGMCLSNKMSKMVSKMVGDTMWVWVDFDGYLIDRLPGIHAFLVRSSGLIGTA